MYYLLLTNRVHWVFAVTSALAARAPKALDQNSSATRFQEAVTKVISD